MTTLVSNKIAVDPDQETTEWSFLDGVAGGPQGSSQASRGHSAAGPRGQWESVDNFILVSIREIDASLDSTNVIVAANIRIESTTLRSLIEESETRFLPASKMFTHLTNGNESCDDTVTVAQS